MRLFEILILISLLIVFVWPIFSRRRPRWLSYLPLLTVGLLVVHLLVEGLRWQMWPAYLLAVLAIVSALFGLRQRAGQAEASRRWPGVVGGLLGTLVWLVAAALPWVLPVPSLPEPTGAFAVGTVSYELVDEARLEAYSTAPDDKRRFMAQVWYPVDDPAGAESSPYLDRVEIAAPALAKSFGFPDFLFNHLDLAKNYAFLEAPPSTAGPFPILVFSHGLTGFRGQNSYQMEELASHGYVVAAIDHTYGNRVSVFPDNTVIEYDGTLAFPPGVENAGNILVRTWAGDISYLLDEMGLWAAGRSGADPIEWSNLLDLERIGVFGHSTGGGTAMELCAKDDRCDAVVGLDTWAVPVSDDVVEGGLEQPLMFISTSLWMVDERLVAKNTLFASSANERFDLTVAGADHYDVTDFPGFSPLTPRLGITVTENGTIAQDAAQAYTRAFFDRYLRGIDSELLDGPSLDFPTIDFVSATP